MAATRLALALLFACTAAVARAKTCGELRATYRAAKCCGNPAAQVKVMPHLMDHGYLPPAELPAQVCTPNTPATLSCDLVDPGNKQHCDDYVPGTCYDITEISQSLIPDMRECYAVKDSALVDASLLWNQRVGRGYPALATLEAIGTMHAKHMAIDVALMFDHWGVVAHYVQEILAEDPNDAHALFVKAMYGFKDVLPGVAKADVPAIVEKLMDVAPKTAKMVDRALADVTMLWEHEFQTPFYGPSDSGLKDMCETGMGNFSDVTGLFSRFECVALPEDFHPKNVGILIFGANNDVLLDVRIHAATMLASKFPDAPIIATGGNLGTFDRAEGDLILERMTGQGVKEERIIVDRLARDTIGNSLAIATYLEENSIDNLLVVTSTFHGPRATAALRGVLQRADLHPRTYMVLAGNNLQANRGTWNADNQAWLNTAYGGGGRFRAIEIPMTNRDFARGAGLFTQCDFEELNK